MLNWYLGKSSVISYLESAKETRVASGQNTCQRPCSIEGEAATVWPSSTTASQGQLPEVLVWPCLTKHRYIYTDTSTSARWNSRGTRISPCSHHHVAQDVLHLHCFGITPSPADLSRTRLRWSRYQTRSKTELRSNLKIKHCVAQWWGVSS